MSRTTIREEDVTSTAQPDLHSQVRHDVTEQFNAERKDAERKLADTLRLEREVAKEHDKLSDTYWRIARKNLDAEPTDKEKDAERKADAAYARLRGVWGALASLRRTLDQFSDAHLERRIQERVETLSRVNALRGRNGEGRMTATATEKRSTNGSRAKNNVEVPAELRKRIAKLVKDGMGVSAVASLLNDEKVKRPASGKPDWYARAIYNVATKELGVDDLKSIRKSKPLASRAVADNPPRKTTALPKKNGSIKKTTAARPLSRKSQAAGTSRGGSGTRKSSAKTRSVARRRGSSKRK